MRKVRRDLQGLQEPPDPKGPLAFKVRQVIKVLKVPRALRVSRVSLEQQVLEALPVFGGRQEQQDHKAIRGHPV